MRTIVRRAAIVVAGCGVALGLAASPSWAGTQSHQDPRGDVQSVRLRAAVDRDTLDVVSLANRYAGQRLTLRMTVADRSARGYFAQWVIRANSTRYLMSADYRRRQPRVEFHRIPPHRTSHGAPRTGGRGCRAISFEPVGNRLIASVSSRCFGGDESVRVSGAVFTTTPGVTRLVVDDSRRKGFGSGDGPTFGPVLRRD